MPDILTSTIKPGVSAEATVYTPATSPPTVATIIGILVANNGDGPGTQIATVRIQRGATSVNVIKGVSIPSGDTFVPSGFEGKIVLLPGDNLRVGVNIGTVDVTVSSLEQS